ncbi:MAG: hypothetical protein K0U74_05475 [Alphaproteobacteria bacterium]|nr:hypothetical protein [Alphaproteobacteria bacterium]
MNGLTRSFGMIASINAQLLGAALNAAIAWVSWPTAAKWWGFGVISILCGAAAISMLVAAIKSMITLYLRDRTLAEYQAQAKAQKNAEMASNDALKNAGVIDG